MPFDSLTNHPANRTFLPRRDSLVLDNAAGTVIAVDRGCLWITLERDLRDIVLVKGMRFQIDRGGRTVIAAEEDSQLRLIRPQPLVERTATRLRRAILRHLREWSTRLYRQSVPYY
jgi:hypothetical protein